jgi:hypothetical protein
MLYHSESGREFLGKLNETQEKMIMDYINPEQWALKLIKNRDDVEEVRKMLSTAGY